MKVLSELEKVTDVDKIEMGVHGVLVRKGFSSGVYLPQVATETGWSKEEFLSRCCAGKAGLELDAWKDPDTEVLLFTADILAEKQQTPQYIIKYFGEPYSSKPTPKRVLKWLRKGKRK